MVLLEPARLFIFGKTPTYTVFLHDKYQNIPTHTKIYKFINICMRKPPTSKYFKYIFFQMSILRQVVKNQVKIVHWRHPVEFWYPQTSQTNMNYEQFEHKQSLISVHCLKKVATFKQLIFLKVDNPMTIFRQIATQWCCRG